MGTMDQAAVLQHLSGVLWNNEALSDCTLKACGRDFHLHKVLVLQSPKLKREIEQKDCTNTCVEWTNMDEHVTAEGLELALGYLYGRKPVLDEKVLAAAAFLELEELGRNCIGHICANLDLDTFLGTLQFATTWKGCERAVELEAFCWKYLSRTAFRETRPLLSQLSLSQLERLFTADELWVPTEADRFRLIVQVLEPKLFEARENLSDAVVENVLNDVVEQVSDPGAHGENAENGCHGRGLKRVGSLGANEGVVNANGPKKQCYFEPGTGPPERKSNCLRVEEELRPSCGPFCDVQVPMLSSAPQGHGTDGNSQLESGRQNQIAALDEVSTDSEVLNGAVASASDVMNIMNRVLSGDEGLLYGSIGFGSLLGVRGKLKELELDKAEDALKEGLWEKELLSSLITFDAFKNSVLKCVDSMYNTADLRIQAMNFKAENEWMFSNGVSLPRLRFSVEFGNVSSLARKSKSDMRSEQIYFAGSLFRVVLTIHVEKTTKERTIGIFLQRSSDIRNSFVDASGFTDPRPEIDAQITFIAGTGKLEVIELCGRISPPHNNKGYSRFLPFSSIKDYLSPSGTLRVTVIVTPLFESVEVKSPIYVKAGQ